MLRIDNLSKSFGIHQILKDISFTLDEGVACALIGESGSGKSTLLNCISLISPPSLGSIFLEGNRLEYRDKSFKNSSIYPMLTAVFQQPQLWPHMSIEKNICMPAIKNDLFNNDKANELSARLNIDHLLIKYPSQISMGEAQRVALVRALLLQPKVILLDEITSAQDIKNIVGIMSVLQEYIDDGLSLIFSTHLLGFAKNFSQQIVFLHKGELREKGTHEIICNPKTKEMKEYLKYSELFL